MDIRAADRVEMPGGGGHRQFGLRRMFVATAGVAVVLGLAAWGGWIHSDATAYLSIVMAAAVMFSRVRRVVLGGCAILIAWWLAMVLAELLFGIQGRGGNPRGYWIFACILAFFAVVLRTCTKAGTVSLVGSLLLAEAFTAIVIVYTYGYPTLFQALGGERRAYVLQHLRGNFPVREQWLIVPPWLGGIVLGGLLSQLRRLLLRRR